MPDFPITINSQEEFDGHIETRIQRLRNQWEREGGLADTQRERDEARSRATKAERDAHDRLVKREARDVLTAMNVKDPKVQQTVMRLADFGSVAAGDDGEPNRKQITDAIKAVHGDTPSVFGEDVQVVDGAPDTGDAGSDETGGPLTQEQVSNMSPTEINSNWDRVKAFLSGERS
jgi:hypothetical protein